jgi:hypothetical protein
MLGQLFSAWQTKALAGLALAFVLLMWRADHISGQRDKAREALAAEQVRHNATRASVDALQASLARYVAEGQLRREQADKALREARSANAAALRNAEALNDGRTDVRGVGL